jgi:hypothetical protein
VKWLPPRQWTSAFRNTRKYGIPCNTQEGHSFLQRLSEGKNSTPFIHGTEHIKSEWHKAVPQVTLGINLISTNQWRKIEQRTSHTHKHTHTHTYIQGGDILIVMSKWVNTFYLLNSSIEQDQKSLNTRTPWCIPSISTMLMTDFDSSSLLHA